MSDPMATHYCKYPGCENEARSRVGRYAYCAEHQSQRPAQAPRDDTMTARIASLAAGARKVDAARAKAEKLTRAALQAKRDADTLADAFTDSMNELLRPPSE
jgi:hypothetical protein